MSAIRYPFIRLIAAAVLVTGALALAACGEDESEGASDGGGASSQEDRARDAALKYAECMREHGVDMPDPQVDEDGGIRIQRKGGGGNPDQDREAEEACQKHMKSAGGRAPSEEQQQQMRERALAFAQCMRDHGVDFPDPQFQEGGKVMMGGKGLDPNDPDFQEAQEACQDKMPKGFGGGQGGKP
jgi:hypothetical protein